MNFVYIALALIVVLLLYILYMYYQNQSQVLLAASSVTGGQITVTSTSNLPSTSVNSVYSLWVYMNDSTLGSPTPTLDSANQYFDNLIFARYASGGNANSAYIAAWVTNKSADLYVGFFDSANTFETIDINKNVTLPTKTDMDSSITNIIHVTDNFPFQEWAFLCVVTTGQIVDVYLNGALIHSRKLDTTVGFVSSLAKNDAIVCGKFNGYVSTFMLTPNALGPGDILSMYNSGNSTMSRLGYSVSLDVTDSQNVDKTYKLM